MIFVMTHQIAIPIGCLSMREETSLIYLLNNLKILNFISYWFYQLYLSKAEGVGNLAKCSVVSWIEPWNRKRA